MEYLSKQIDVEMLKELMLSRDVFIYGTGYVASFFYESLKKIGFDINIIGFVETKKTKHSYYGKTVFDISEVPNRMRECKEILVCIAVHESLKNEIENQLQQNGISDFIWIYPYQYELLLGKPAERHVFVKTRDIANKLIKQYIIETRWLAIEEYYGINNYGYSVYKKLEGIHCSNLTAEKRLNSFIKVIESWDKFGYTDSSDLVLLNNLDLIDGYHRLALALYHNDKYVRCTIYRSDSRVVDIHSRESLLFVEDVNNILDDDSKKCLKIKKKQIFG